MNADDKELAVDVLEFLITADIINRNEELTKLDLPKKYWKFFGTGSYNTDIERPIAIGESVIIRLCRADNVIDVVKQNPFVKFDEFGKRFSITTLDAAAGWFIRQAGKERVMQNPVLAFYYEKCGEDGISHKESLENVPGFTDSKEYLEARVNHIIGDDEDLKAARGLIIISSPEEIEYSLDDLVCTPKQQEGIRKIKIALKNRDFLNERRIFEFGKLLFVGPPGTGKTSLALAMSKELKMPMLEVRLAMVTSQYLGETSKNIDRIFELARSLSPCILFIDEFDFVAKSRVTEDNGAMKRAVNMLLKNIDTVSFVRNGVVLIGATNHPGILDEAAWRRFDDVVEFPLPGYEMRVEILKKITRTLDCTCDFEGLAYETEGFSGADLRIMIKESLISALMRDSFELSECDIEQGMGNVRERDTIRQSASI